MNDLNPILVSYKYIINYSTMSLKEQLSLLQKDKVKRIGPGAIVPSLLLDKDTSRNTSIDVLYTMAILGFNKLKNTLV